MGLALLRPRLLGLACASAAVAMGVAYMLAAGAPVQYLTVNVAALVLGVAAWLALGRMAQTKAPAGGWVLALSVPLLLTALFGTVVEGASRWVQVGPLTLQISLIVVPLMTVLFARRPSLAGTAGIVVAAFALALQPDRAMAGALAASLVALALVHRNISVFITLAAAVLAFGWSLLMPDTLSAAPFVEQVFYTAFDAHIMAGLAVIVGAALLVVPAALSFTHSPCARSALLAFGGCWSAVVVAAALGNYPTPLVGYGGSAVLGYILSVAMLPDHAEARGRHRASGSNGRTNGQSDRFVRSSLLA